MLTFKVVSALLVYPEEEVIACLDEMAAVLTAENLLAADDRRGVETLIEWLKTTDLLDVQAAYVGSFDQSRSLSLHLFEHIHGESRDRGQALVDLLAHYRSKGFDIATVELPDFLPLFLEFLSTQPPADARDLLGETVDVISLLRARLEKRRSPYVAVLRAIEALAPRRADSRALEDRVAGEKADDTPEALDRTWEEAPVTFNDATPVQASCGTACSAARSMVDRFAMPVAGRN